MKALYIKVLYHQKVPRDEALDGSAESILNTEVLAHWTARLESLVSEVIDALSKHRCQCLDQIRLLVTLAVRNTNTYNIY